MLQAYPSLTVPASGELIVHATGAFVTCLEASFDFRLAVDSAPPTLFAKGLTYRPPSRFTGLRVVNPSSSAALIVTLVVGMGELVDRRLVDTGAQALDPVTVDQIRQYAYRSQQEVTPGAGDIGHCQLWNPSGSGVLGVVRSIYVHSTVAGQVTGRWYGTALSTDNKDTLSAYGAASGNHGLLQLRSESDSAQIGVGSLNLFSVRVTVEMGFARFDFGSPLVIPEGQGLVVLHNEVGPLTLDVGADILELPA